MRRCGAVRIAHAEINHVAPGGARLGLQRVDFAEDVRGKALDAIELFGHGGSAADGRPLVTPEPLFCERYRMDFLEQKRALIRQPQSTAEPEVVSFGLIILHRLMQDIVGR